MGLTVQHRDCNLRLGSQYPSVPRLLKPLPHFPAKVAAQRRARPAGDQL